MLAKGHVVRFMYGRNEVVGTLEDTLPTGVTVLIANGTEFVPWSDIRTIRAPQTIPSWVSPALPDAPILPGAKVNAKGYGYGDGRVQAVLPDGRIVIAFPAVGRKAVDADLVYLVR